MTEAQRGFMRAVVYLDLLDYWVDEPDIPFTLWLKDGTSIEVDYLGFVSADQSEAKG